jgi:hypothetical protein
MIDLIDPGDAFGEDRFAGPVVSSQRGYLPGVEVQVDLRERLHGTKVLVDPSSFEERLAKRRGVRPSRASRFLGHGYHFIVRRGGPHRHGDGASLTVV